MFRALVVFAVALSSASCSKFVVGVRLLLPERPRPPAPACELLRSRSLANWREDAFRNCIFKHAGETFAGHFAISYSITVDPAKFSKFPLHDTYAGKVSFVNRQLNLDRGDCLTVAGSHWGRPMQDSGIQLQIELYVKIGINEVTPVTYNTTEKWLHNFGQGLHPFSCFHEKLQLADPTLLQHRFILHAQVATENDLIPPSQDVLSAILHTISSEEFLQSNCVRVANARYNATGNIWSFDLYAPSQYTELFVCQPLRSRIGFRPIICYATGTFNRRHNGLEQLFRLNLDAGELGQSATNTNGVEASIRAHFLVNGEISGCMVAKVDQLKKAFEPVPFNGYYSAVLSGPVGEHFCQTENTRSPFTAHSCAVIRRPLEEGGSGVYRFQPEEPFYALDLPWFMNKHHERVIELNRRNAHCDFNGFIQLNTDDPIEEERSSTSEVYTY